MPQYPNTLIMPEPDSFPDEKTLSAAVLGALSQWFSIETEVPGRYRGEQIARIDAVLRPLDPAPWADEDPAFGVEFKLPTSDMGDRDYFMWAAQAVDYAHVDWGGYGRLQIFVCPSPIMAVVWSPGQLAHFIEHRKRLESYEHALELERRFPSFSRVPASLEERARRTQQRYVQMFRRDDEDAIMEGFADGLDRTREQRHHTGRAMMHLLGQLNVGELTQVRDHGWSLLRSGHMLWCSHCGVRNRWSLKPQLASRH